MSSYKGEEGDVAYVDSRDGMATIVPADQTKPSFRIPASEVEGLETQPVVLPKPEAPDDQLAGIWILSAIVLGLVVGLLVGGIVGYFIGVVK